jgi:hypothetical protein
LVWALATVITPAPLGSASVICSLSLESTAHPAGTGSVKATFDAVGPVGVVGDAIGLGEPPGVGLGTSDVMPALPAACRLLKSAIAVPQDDQREDRGQDQDPRGAVNGSLRERSAGRVVRARIGDRSGRWRSIGEGQGGRGGR